MKAKTKSPALTGADWLEAVRAAHAAASAAQTALLAAFPPDSWWDYRGHKVQVLCVTADLRLRVMIPPVRPGPHAIELAVSAVPGELSVFVEALK